MLFSIQSSFLSMFATFNIPVIQTMQLTLQMRKLRFEDSSRNMLKGTWKSCQNWDLPLGLNLKPWTFGLFLLQIQCPMLYKAAKQLTQGSQLAESGIRHLACIMDAWDGSGTIQLNHCLTLLFHRWALSLGFWLYFLWYFSSLKESNFSLDPLLLTLLSLLPLFVIPGKGQNLFQYSYGQTLYSDKWLHSFQWSNYQVLLFSTQLEAFPAVWTLSVDLVSKTAGPNQHEATQAFGRQIFNECPLHQHECWLPPTAKLLTAPRFHHVLLVLVSAVSFLLVAWVTATHFLTLRSHISSSPKPFLIALVLVYSSLPWILTCVTVVST